MSVDEQGRVNKMKLERSQSTLHSAGALVVKKPALSVTPARVRAALCYDIVTGARSFRSIESAGTACIFGLLAPEVKLVTKKTIKADILQHFDVTNNHVSRIFAALKSKVLFGCMSVSTLTV
jgi:hypothetical protein